MKTIHLHFKKNDRWLWLLVWGLLLLAGQVRGQVYSVTYGNTLSFKYFDVTTQSWTTKTNPPEYLINLAFYQGKVYGSAFSTTNFYVYDPATNTWTAKAPSPVSNLRIARAGNYIYALQRISPYSFAKYDLTTDSWTQLSNTGVSANLATNLAYDGGDYIYAGYQGTVLGRYSISEDTWTIMPTPPTYTSGIAFKNGKLYIVSNQLATLYSFDPGTSTYTKLANPAGTTNTMISGDDNYLYSISYNGNVFQRYDISTNTWITFNSPGTTFYGLTSAFGTCSPTATATAVQATCGAGGVVNANATLTLNTYGGGVTKVGYSAGSTYTGPAFSAATAVTAAPMTLVNNLVNPTVQQPYTIRAFQDATCYKDVVVTLAPTQCLTSDLSLSLSPMTQTGAKGELLTYTLTLTNAGPDPAANVKIDVKLPTNTTLLTASPQVGTYSAATQKWNISSLPVGLQTLIITLKMN